MKNTYYIDKSQINKTLTVLSKIRYMKHDIRTIDKLLDKVIYYNQQTLKTIETKEQYDDTRSGYDVRN